MVKNNMFKNKINKVVYISNWFLAVLHIFYLIFYIIEGADPLTLICMLSLIIYIYFLIVGINNNKMFGTISYICIWSHTVLATIYFGWNVGYYQWLYALICAYFLPSFDSNIDELTKRPIYRGIIFIMTFFGLYFLTHSDLIVSFKLDEKLTGIIFTINAIIVFITIMTFTYFFTKRQKLKEEVLNERAEFDQLTNLRNRYGINKVIDKKIKKDSFVVGILDIDFFKKVNDTYGHDAGDFILRQVALRLKILEGYGIMCARWGGEEFIIISESEMSLKQFKETLEVLRKNIEDSYFKFNENTINITVSIGISEYNKNLDIAKVLKEADEKLYTAKENGRNKIIL